MARPSSIALAALVLLSGCVIDSDAPCSDNQEVAVITNTFGAEEETCVCVAGAVPSVGGGCELCPPGTGPFNGACVPLNLGDACDGSAGDDSATNACDEGAYSYCYQRDDSIDGYCTKTVCTSNDDCPFGYSCFDDGDDSNTLPVLCVRDHQECNGTNLPCEAGARFDYCRIAGGETSGFCTQDECTTDDGCGADYACVPAAGADPAYCDPPPFGHGAPCATDADCQIYDAQFCLTFSRTCFASGCTAGTAGDGSDDDPVCSGATQCCDFSSAGIANLCSPSCQQGGG